jgi:chaperonin GroES
MNLKPLRDRIVVEPSASETQTPGGILIPETATDAPEQGTVVAKGPGQYEDGIWVSTDITVGDKVMYGKYSGTEIEFENKKYLILRASDVMAVMP